MRRHRGSGLLSLLGLARRKKRVHRRHRGAGFFGDLWDGVKGVAGSIAVPVLSGLVRSKLGMARRKKRVRRHRGSGWRDVLSKVNNFLKSTRVVSRGLTHLGHPKLSNFARSHGYARRRRHAVGGYRRIAI